MAGTSSEPLRDAADAVKGTVSHLLDFRAARPTLPPPLSCAGMHM